MHRSLVLVATVLLASCAQKPQAAEPRDVIAAIARAEEAQSEALGRGDLEGAVAIFADDATVYMQGHPPARGKAAIKALNERVLKDPALNVAIDKGSRKWWIAASGNLATTTYSSAWTHTDARSGKPLTEQLISQTTWQKQPDGSWKNVADINAVYPRG